MENYNLNFHQTFSPDRNYLSILLEKSNFMKKITKEDISKLTGVPTGTRSGKVEPHLKYLKYMNLIDYDKEGPLYTVRKTELGKIISNEDPYMNEEITMLIINYFLTSKRYGAEMWYIIFREIPYMNGNSVQTSIVNKEIEKYYNKKVKLGAFNGTYTNLNGFSNLGILKIDDSLYKYNSIRYKYEDIYVYLYTLVTELEKFETNRKEFTINEIFDDIKWNLGFQWSINEGISILNHLEEKGLININRQLNPITIILNKRSNAIIRDIYSLLL